MSFNWEVPVILFVGLVLIAWAAWATAEIVM